MTNQKREAIMQPSANGNTPNGTYKLYPHTFEDSGISIHIKRLNPLTLYEVHKSIPRPKPPMNKVKWGDEERWEENPSDPDYQAALESYNVEVNFRVLKFIILRGTVVDMTESRMAEVSQLREEMLESFAMELDPSDKYVWVVNFGIGSESDMKKMQEAILRRSQPTEVAINEAVETFRG